MSNVRRALHRVWDTIGADILQCAEVNQLPKAELIEVVLDANYLEMYGGLDKEELKAFRALSYDDQIKEADNAFTYSYYGY